MAVQTSTSQPATSVQPAASQTATRAQTAKIDTQPMKKAYDDWSKILGGLNGQIRNYNIKTAFKIAFIALAFLASAAAITFAAFSLLGSSFPLIAFSSKVLASSAIGVGITLIFAKIFKNVISRRLLEAQNKFLAKIKADFQKNKYNITDPIIEALFKKLYRGRPTDICSHFSFQKLKGGFYSVKKIELDSFEKVEKRYKKYYEYDQRCIRNRRTERESARKLKKEVGKQKEDIDQLKGGLSLNYIIMACRGAYLALRMFV